MKKLALITGVILIASVAVAQEAPALGWVDKVLALIPVDGAVVATIAMVLEFGLRLIKTEKPKSMIYLVADAIKGVALILAKVGLLLDKVLPQRVKAPEPQEAPKA